MVKERQVFVCSIKMAYLIVGSFCSISLFSGGCFAFQ